MTIGNLEVEALADTLDHYYYLLHLDLSHNRIEGLRGGTAIARIIARNVEPQGGVRNLRNLSVAHNKLESAGFGAILSVLVIANPEKQQI